MNYAEELAYWFFRLNGFFMISNYVNHRSHNLRYTHDTDLLAIRLPYVRESVGQYYSEKFIDEKNYGLIIEVKSSYYNCDSIFSDKKILKENIERLGLLIDVDRVVELLFESKDYEDDNIKIMKILIAKDIRESPKYSVITFEEILDYIRRKKELFRKHEDRMFFNSNLIQFLFSDIGI